MAHPALLAKTVELEADVDYVGGQLLRYFGERLIKGCQQQLSLLLGDNPGLYGRLYPSWQHRHKSPLPIVSFIRYAMTTASLHHRPFTLLPKDQA